MSFVSYFCIKNILSLLIFYIVTTLKYDIQYVISYIKKIVTNFEISHDIIIIRCSKEDYTTRIIFPHVKNIYA
ncbi:hypothetical protein C923_00925 [Plasmodium falciparum UGT5.1]|uniref:Uncharacterized protein n=1 Tax=Plasmodium falciparum UGT5.1 TaxID=1237627 RepID=W7K389_PLAFA|nr:hypothetical protein C923_00925 [Plasmodium falciparum UGT5.1]